MAITFSQMLDQARSRGQIADASKWFEQTFSDLRSPTHSIINKDDRYLTRDLQIGKMYLFHYDPKHKDKLPLYDRFPIIFPFDYAPNGFYGINFHYIPYIQRARLLDSLMSASNSKSMSDKMKLNLSYDILKAIANSKYFLPCIKRYLNNHVRSRFLMIPSSQWAKALFLPLEQFVYKK
jgi:hypothetical protein